LLCVIGERVLGLTNPRKIGEKVYRSVKLFSGLMNILADIAGDGFFSLKEGEGYKKFL
jgi:hypothetical protein